MMNNLAFKLLDTTSFSLLLNTNLRHFSVVSEVLSYHGIPFDTWTPDNDLILNTVELSFTSDFRFSDVYLLAYIFKDYGLEEVWVTRKLDKVVRLGTYFFQAENPERFALADGMKIQNFLKLDPKLDTTYVIDNLFENRYSDDLADEQEYDNNDDYYDHDDYNAYDDYDWERETFDAMTDGQLGDYDDFDGNMDDVMTWAGRD
jgi:hypothetical protein